MARAVVHEAVLVGKQLQLDPLLLLAIIAVESRFDPMAQSTRGAQGLMQVRTSVHSARFDPFGGASAAFDFATNIRIGAQILQEHLTRHGSVDLALKHYVGAARMAHDQGYAAKVRKEKLKLEQILLQSASRGHQTKQEGS
jgi:soluble lytic murein transglycosylase-like protein